MHNAYKVSSKVNGKTINLLYLHCVHRLWAAFRNGAWWLQEVRKHIFPHFTEAETFCASQGHTHQWSREWSWVFQVFQLPYGGQIPPHLHHSIPVAPSSPKAPPASPSPPSARQHSGIGDRVPCLGKRILHNSLGCGGLGCDEDPPALYSVFGLITAEFDSATTMQHMRSAILWGIRVQK